MLSPRLSVPDGSGGMLALNDEGASSSAPQIVVMVAFVLAGMVGLVTLRRREYKD